MILPNIFKALQYPEAFFELLDKVPFRGDPDKSIFPPSLGVGENVNQTRIEQERVQVRRV